MVRVSAYLEITKVEMDALKFEANCEKMTIEELMANMVRQSIPSFLDVVETENEARRQELIEALMSDKEQIEFERR